jgi:hypothetical protein
LANHGGIAVITSVSYSIKVANVVFCDIDYHELVKKLKDHGLVSPSDYSLIFFSAGWSLGSKDERIIFELNSKSFLEKNIISAIDIKLEFRSLLGDSYEKKIYCIPRRGILESM